MNWLKTERETKEKLENMKKTGRVKKRKREKKIEKWLKKRKDTFICNKKIKEKKII